HVARKHEDDRGRERERVERAAQPVGAARRRDAAVEHDRVGRAHVGGGEELLFVARGGDAKIGRERGTEIATLRLIGHADENERFWMRTSFEFRHRPKWAELWV